MKDRMKFLRNIWVIACAVWAVNGVGQPSPIPSLIEAYSQTEARTDRIRIAVRIAKAYDQINADSVLRYADRALDLLQDDDSLRLRYDTYMTLSRAGYVSNQKQAMRQASETALGIAKEIGDSLLIAKSYRSLAMAAPAVSQEEARAYIEKAIQLAKGTTDAHRRMQILSYQIQAYLIKYQDPQRAQEIRRQILKQALALNDSSLIAKTYATFGTYYRNIEVDSAIYFFFRAKKIYESLNQPSFLADVAGKLGTCYQLKDMRDSVLIFARQAVELGKASGNQAAQRSGLRMLLSHHQEQKLFQTALTYAKELLELESNHPSGFGSLALIDLSQIYRDLGEYPKARTLLEEALNKAQQDKYPPGIATAHAQLGEMDMKGNDLASAMNHFQAADGMYARMKIEAARLRTFQRMGEIRLQQQRFQEAKQHFSNLMKTAENFLDLSSLANAHHGLARCDSALGQSQAALKHFSLYSQFSDSFHRQTFNEEVAELQTQLETEKQQTQIRELQQEAELQELQLSQAQRERNLFLLIGLLGIGSAGIIGYFFLQIRKNRKQIAQQAQELLSLNQTKDDLFGIIAHDLRAPISGFQTLGRIFSHYLPQDSPPPLKKISQQLEQQSTQLNRLLDNLLQWALQQLGRYDPVIDTFALTELTKEVVDLHSPAALAKGNQLFLEMPQDLELKGDRQGWSIVLNNLLSNAIKFTEQGEIRISVEGKGLYRKLLVQDSGVGMSAEQLELLTQKASVVSTKGTLGERGTGLGLRIVRQLLEQWGYEMEIQSQKGKGTSIEIMIKP